MSSWIIKIKLQRLLHKLIKLYKTAFQSYYKKFDIFKEKLKIFYTPIFQQIITDIKYLNKDLDVKN